jgi:beta-N-acetylhexosaminidase
MLLEICTTAVLLLIAFLLARRHFFPTPPEYLPLILAVKGSTLCEDDIAFFREYRPVGTILVTRNLDIDSDGQINKEKLRQLCAQIRAYSPYILIDQEGGRITHLKGSNVYDPPPPGTFSADVNESNFNERIESLRKHVALIDRDLTDAGITVNCAPVADLLFENVRSVIGDRSFGTDPQIVQRFSVEWVRQAARDGIISVLKHCPGHGSTELDTHLAQSVVRKTREELQRTDFAVFKGAIETLNKELPREKFWVMVGHIVFQDIDPENPATQSEAVIRIIRDEFGFGGIIVTDCVSMKALKGEMWERAVASLRAGCDYAVCVTWNLNEKRLIAQKVREYVKNRKDLR